MPKTAQPDEFVQAVCIGCRLPDPASRRKPAHPAAPPDKGGETEPPRDDAPAEVEDG